MVIRLTGIQVSHRKSSRTGETSVVTIDNRIPLVVPGAQETEHDRKPAQSVGDHERRVETRLQEWLQPFTEGLTRRSSSSTDVSPADVTMQYREWRGRLRLWSLH